MEARGFIVQPTYRVRGGVPIVQLWGRLASGEAFLVEDDRFRPYFFAPEAKVAAIPGAPDLRVEPSPLRSLRGEALVRITAQVPAAVPPLRERIRKAGGEVLEADVRFPTRYLIDHGIGAGLTIRGDPEPGHGLRRFRNPELRPSEGAADLRTLSLDIETSPDAGRIYSVALAGGETAEVHLQSEHPVEGAIVHADEAALLAGTLERIRELDPDVLLGWAVVDFDLRVLARRCEVLRVPFHLGRTDDPPRFQQDPGFTRRTRADVPGRVVLDGVDLAREALRLPDYRLETVARHVLGRGKRIDQSAPDKAAEITRMFEEDPAALVAYNLEDAVLVPELLAREGLLDLTIERSRLSGMPLDRVSSSIASFDRVYLPELRARGYVAPSVDLERKGALIQGGALLDPVAGLYRRVAVFDFKSLYPSLMRTFQLDPLAHGRAGKDAIVAPNGARFAREGAILPGILERFMDGRAAAKQRGDRHADQSIKIMLNALFGVLGASSCRFFDAEVANAITGFGQQTLHWTREAFESLGVRVLYGDTDSVFVELGAGDRAGFAESLRDQVQDAIAERIRREYRVEPRLELELERIFDRLLLPRLRGARGSRAASGSKKRYAGFVDGQLVLVGLESVRRDWPEVATRLQQGMLERLFGDEEVEPFVREVVDAVRAGRLDDELVYSKRLRKGTLDRYTRGAPPHVQAARKLPGRAPRSVRYVITRRGPEPVSVGVPLPDDIDRAHYVERVLRPVAEGILCEIGSGFDRAMGQPTQLDLL
ncbi:MAG: DNA polymerase II [Myxococcota bacterium]|nr:DNA polymerase II [Myxococcota bacterium]